MNRNKFQRIFIFIYMLMSVLIGIMTIVLSINIVENKGIMPMIFLAMIFFYISLFLSGLRFNYFSENIKYKYKFKISYVLNSIKFIIAIVFFFVTVKVFWS